MSYSPTKPRDSFLDFFSQSPHPTFDHEDDEHEILWDRFRELGRGNLNLPQHEHPSAAQAASSAPRETPMFFAPPQRHFNRSALITETENRLFRETAEALQNHNLNEEDLRSNYRMPNGFFGELEKKMLIYLVTGIPYEVIGRDPLLPLRDEQKLTPINAILEINDLCLHQKYALESLYAHGLRGDHLRAFQPASEEDFSHAHGIALACLIRGRNSQPPLTPETAMTRINGSTFTQVFDLIIGRTGDESAAQAEQPMGLRR